MKYIDAEKLINAIEEKGLDCSYALKMERLDTLALIAELQQEQPEQTCKTCGFYENNCPFIRGKLIPYPNKVCNDYTYSAMKEQEQMEADLEKELEHWRHNHFHGERDGEYSGEYLERESQLELARHLYGRGYERGLNAKKADK